MFLKSTIAAATAFMAIASAIPDIPCKGWIKPWCYRPTSTPRPMFEFTAMELSFPTSASISETTSFPPSSPSSSSSCTRSSNTSSISIPTPTRPFSKIPWSIMNWRKNVINGTTNFALHIPMTAFAEATSTATATAAPTSSKAQFSMPWLPFFGIRVPIITAHSTVYRTITMIRPKQTSWLKPKPHAMKTSLANTTPTSRFIHGLKSTPTNLSTMTKSGPFVHGLKSTA